MTLLLIALGCAGLSWALTRLLHQSHAGKYFLDHPNERSLHSRPIPRSGGVALWLAAVPAVAAVTALEGWPPHPLEASVAVFLIGIIALADDLKSLPGPSRFIVQGIAALLVCTAGLVPRVLALPGYDLAWAGSVAVVFTWLYLMWFTNLYNFMDGMDGFAGGMAVIGFGSFALLGWIEGHQLFCAMSLILAAAASGFLLENFPPARVFMGDMGSSTLGFCAAMLSLWAETAGIFPLWTAVLVFAPFVVDATFTLLARALRGERVWVGHCGHYYQRLVRMGWGHRRTVLFEYLLMVICAGSAVVAHLQAQPRVQWIIILGVLALCFGLMHAVARMEKRPRP